MKIKGICFDIQGLDRVTSTDNALKHNLAMVSFQVNALYNFK